MQKLGLSVTTILVGLIGFICILAMYLIGTYNGLISSKESVDSQWAQVENQYQRRFDLIPNLVESVKGIMQQEKDVFDSIAEARTRYSGASTVSQKAEAAGEVESALSRLLVVMENYPELKSSENVSTLMTQLEGTENRISVERKRYNELVETYNVKVKRFPTNIFSNMMGFEAYAYFESTEGADTAPQVKFGEN